MNNTSSDSTIKIYLAPLQGFTDYSFRAAFSSLFGAPDAAYSPFIDTHDPDKRIFRDVLPEKITGYHLIPQLLGNDAKEMLTALNELILMGYKEVNLNLGCPYKMVTKKGMGAGLLPHPERIDRILSELFANTACRISVKMRLGLTNNEDWKAIVPVLNRYPLNEVIIHARTAAQMYKGDTNVDVFTSIRSLTKSLAFTNSLLGILMRITNGSPAISFLSTTSAGKVREFFIRPRTCEL